MKVLRTVKYDDETEQFKIDFVQLELWYGIINRSQFWTGSPYHYRYLLDSKKHGSILPTAHERDSSQSGFQNKVKKEQLQPEGRLKGTHQSGATLVNASGAIWQLLPITGAGASTCSGSGFRWLAKGHGNGLFLPTSCDGRVAWPEDLFSVGHSRRYPRRCLGFEEFTKSEDQSRWISARKGNNCAWRTCLQDESVSPKNGFGFQLEYVWLSDQT